MVRRRKQRDVPNGGGVGIVNVPAQDDEGSILEEVEAERDEDGALIVDEKKILEVGAVDAETVRENRRQREFVNKKRANVKGAVFNAGDVLSHYETVIKYWPANTLDISVRRLTGAPVQQVITSHPRSGSELYEAIKVIHGQYGEAEYEVKLFDTNRKEFRGTSRITMPDTRPPGQQGQPMNPYYQPPGYPSHVQQYGAPNQTPMAQAPQPPQPMQQPAIQAPIGFDPNSIMAMFQQMFQMFQQMQSAVQQQPPQPAAPMMPPPPPAGSDPNAQMAWMQQAFEFFQRMQSSAAPPRGVQQPAQYSPPGYAPPPVQGMPPMQPPPGTMWVWVPNAGWVAQAIGVAQPSAQPHTYRPPPYAAREQPPPPPPQRSAASDLREALMVVRTAADVLQNVNDILPNHRSVAEDRGASNDDDDSPIRVVKTRVGDLIYGKEDNALRKWETGLANMDKVFKWIGEQREAIQENANQQRRQQQPKRVLPPGYVEVDKDYRPPPGWVAVPEPLPHEPPPTESFPPPPADMPPPIQTAPPKKNAWGMPPISGQGGG